jgi:hypothetical protein
VVELLFIIIKKCIVKLLLYNQLLVYKFSKNLINILRRNANNLLFKVGIVIIKATEIINIEI